MGEITIWLARSYNINEAEKMLRSVSYLVKVNICRMEELN